MVKKEVETHRLGDTLAPSPGAHVQVTNSGQAEQTQAAHSRLLKNLTIGALLRRFALVHSPLGRAKTVPSGRALARRVMVSALMILGSMIATCQAPRMCLSTTPPADVSQTVFFAAGEAAASAAPSASCAIFLCAGKLDTVRINPDGSMFANYEPWGKPLLNPCPILGIEVASVIRSKIASSELQLAFAQSRI